MNQRSRRDFLTDVGTGMVVASIGAHLAADLGFSTAFANQGRTAGRLRPGTSGQLDAGKRLPPSCCPWWCNGYGKGPNCANWWLRAALANARTFGGEDYIGFHTMMAIAPAFHMAGELPAARRALPVPERPHRKAAAALVRPRVRQKCWEGTGNVLLAGRRG